MRGSWVAGACIGMLLVGACAGGGTTRGTATASGNSPAVTQMTSTGVTSSTTPSVTARSTTTTPHTSTRAPVTSPSPSRATPTPTRVTPTPTPTVPVPPPITLPPTLRGAVVTKVPTRARVVVLTFDGGAGSQGASSILATLRAQGVRASFFVTGRFATANPATTRQMAAVGPVGNHTWSHPDLTALSAGAVAGEISSTRSAILATTGRESRPLFRFPYGAYDSRVLGLVHAAGYGGVGWTTDSLGWKGTSGGMTVDKVVSRVLAARTPGQIILMHVGANPDDGTTLDAAALPRIIVGLRSRGYDFITLAALLG